MKKLILKLCILLLFLAGFFCIIIWLSTQPYSANIINQITGCEDYARQPLVSGEVEYAIHKAQTKDGSTKVILGDSVCNAIFGELQDANPDYSMLGVNKGVTLAGQYIMTNEYLKAHENVTDVYLMLITNSMITGFDTDFGYQYAVMPFIKTGTIDLLDEDTVETMRDLYIAPFVTEDGVALIEKSVVARKLYLNVLKKWKPNPYHLEFPTVTTKYVMKMKELCDEHGAKMHFISLPVADIEQRHEIEETLQQRYEESVMYEAFPDFYKNYIYYPAEDFPDGMHPLPDYELRDEMVRVIEEKNGIDFGFVFERH